MEYILLLVVAAIIVLPAVLIGKRILTGKKAKYAMIFNVAAILAICGLTIAGPLGGIVLAAGGAAGTAEIAALLAASGNAFIGAGLAVGLACVGAGIAVASSASTAISAMTENSSIMGRALIFVALGEGIAIYGLLIAIQIINKIPL
ncbi:MAG: ATPase [Clostridia bacterium]|nr:ATPase [Clostridia bacterium]